MSGDKQLVPLQAIEQAFKTGLPPGWAILRMEGIVGGWYSSTILRIRLVYAPTELQVEFEFRKPTDWARVVELLTILATIPQQGMSVEVRMEPPYRPEWPPSQL